MSIRRVENDAAPLVQVHKASRPEHGSACASILVLDVGSSAGARPMMSGRRFEKRRCTLAEFRIANVKPLSYHARHRHPGLTLSFITSNLCKISGNANLRTSTTTTAMIVHSLKRRSRIVTGTDQFQTSVEGSVQTQDASGGIEMVLREGVQVERSLTREKGVSG